MIYHLHVWLVSPIACKSRGHNWQPVLYRYPQNVSVGFEFLEAFIPKICWREGCVAWQWETL